MKRLEGKSILIAGAGGIGNELARRYTSEGASIVLGDINEALAREAAEAITADGGKAIGLMLDGGDESTIKAAVDLAVSRYGGLDGLHANYSSLLDGETDVVSINLKTFDAVMDVNARGFMLCTRHAVPHIVARGGGSIIYTSSGAAHMGEKARLAYAMSKSAIHALMRHVANRYGGDGVRANVIAPGIIMHSNVEARLPEEMLKYAKGLQAFKPRFGRPGDIAALGALLMSDEGGFITGQVISVDGGSSMRP